MFLSPVAFFVVALWLAFVLLNVATSRARRPTWGALAMAGMLDPDNDSAGEVSYSSGSSDSAKPDGRAVLHELLERASTRRAIRGWLLRLHVHEQAVDDVTQNVIRAALESVDRFDPSRGSAQQWLNGIAVHFAYKHRVAQAMRARREAEVPAELLDDAQSADDVLAREATRREVLEAVMQLHPSERTIVAGHDLQGLSMTECAEAAGGIPVSTAYKWRNRGLLRLRDLLAAFEAAEDAPVPTVAPVRPAARRR